jgi:hypothetical protein
MPVTQKQRDAAREIIAQRGGMIDRETSVALFVQTDRHPTLGTCPRYRIAQRITRRVRGGVKLGESIRTVGLAARYQKRIRVSDACEGCGEPATNLVRATLAPLCALCATNIPAHKRDRHPRADLA